MSYLPPQHVIERMAKHCRSCSECGEAPPCDTCMAGGVCMASCTCHEDRADDYYSDDEEPDEYEAATRKDPT